MTTSAPQAEPPEQDSWLAPTRPRRPNGPLAASSAAPPPDLAPDSTVDVNRDPGLDPNRDSNHEPLHWHSAVPFVVVAGLAALGVIVGIVGVLIIRAKMLNVTVVVSGEARQTHTHARTVGDLLDELGIVLNEFDVSAPTAGTELTPGMIVRVDKARGVTLTIDGESRIFWTALSNPADILASARLDPRSSDRVLVDGTQTALTDLAAWPVPANHITLRHAVQLRLNDNGAESTVRTTGETVGDALFEAGVVLYLADRISPDLRAPVSDDLEVTIRRSNPVSIIADGRTVETRSNGDTVVDALADAGVALLGQDYTIPGEDTALRPGMHIRVIRVTEETLTEEVPLPFETVYQADAERELDQREMVQPGREGLQQTVIRVRYENGVEVAREPEETVVAVPPQNRVIEYGTKVVLRTIDTPSGPREYWRVLRVYATSYHPAALGGDNITATGRILQKGVIGVWRPIIPFGTEMYVPGYGVGIAADTGPARGNGMWIDLGYSDHDYEPWHRYTDVYLLTPVPPSIDYLLPQ